MTQIIYRSNPMMQAFMDWHAAYRLANEQRSREEEAERRKEQKLIGQIGGGVLGAVGGLVLGPALGLAGTAGTSAAAGTGVGTGGAAVTAGTGALASTAASSLAGPMAGTAATSGLLGTGGALSGAGAVYMGLQGASVGSQMGGALAGGDVAGALGTAASAVGGLMKMREHQIVYGGNPSKEEIRAMARMATKYGVSLTQLKANAIQGGPTVPQALKTIGLQRATQEEQADILEKAGYDGTYADAQQEMAGLPGGFPELVAQTERMTAFQNAQEAEARAFAQSYGAFNADIQQRAEHSTAPMKSQIPNQEITRSFDEAEEIKALVEGGDYSPAQGLAELQKLRPPAAQLLPDNTPPTAEQLSQTQTVTRARIAPDGTHLGWDTSVVDPAAHPKAASLRHIDFVPKKGDKPTGIELYIEHPELFLKAMSDAASAMTLAAESGAAPPTADGMVEFIDKSFDALERRIAGITAKQDPMPIAEIAQRLSQIRPEQWTPEDIERAAASLEKAFSELEANPNADPAQLDQLAQMYQVIDAQRNR